MSSKLVFVCFLTFSYSSYLFVLFSPSPLYFFGGKEKNKISNFSNVGVISRLGKCLGCGNGSIKFTLFPLPLPE